MKQGVKAGSDAVLLMRQSDDSGDCLGWTSDAVMRKK